AENYSWNCGVEGPTTDAEILNLRRRQAKNLLATLLLSQGVPMLLAGDELLRTQGGNNNAWCQDNDVSWIDWTLAEANADFLRFARKMIALRKQHSALRRRDFFRGAGIDGARAPDIVWHGVEPFAPDFSPASRTLVFCLDGSQTGREPDQDFYIACNAWREALAFRVPPSPSGRPWRRVIDTALAAPLDIVDAEQGLRVMPASRYPLAPFSLIVFVTHI